LQLRKRQNSHFGTPRPVPAETGRIPIRGTSRLTPLCGEFPQIYRSPADSVTSASARAGQTATFLLQQRDRCLLPSPRPHCLLDRGRHVLAVAELRHDGQVANRLGECGKGDICIDRDRRLHSPRHTESMPVMTAFGVISKQVRILSGSNRKDQHTRYPRRFRGFLNWIIQSYDRSPMCSSSCQAG
jgi:hypothetical protein